jgi:hypothetical protein
VAELSTESGKIQTTFEKEKFEEVPLIGDGRTPTAMLISLPMIQNAGGVYSVQFAGELLSQIQTGEDGHTNDGQGNPANNIHDIQEVVAVAARNPNCRRISRLRKEAKYASARLIAELFGPQYVLD